ncbi:hypothetical protein E4T56_gene3334 [Termitomyces sp. T112]|nr:hypothetical protein E4T56_gene3334 [Termitomyces sp. T112]
MITIKRQFLNRNKKCLQEPTTKVAGISIKVVAERNPKCNANTRRYQSPRERKGNSRTHFLLCFALSLTPA